jgi:hypothetical protein
MAKRIKNGDDQNDSVVAIDVISGSCDCLLFVAGDRDLTVHEYSLREGTQFHSFCHDMVLCIPA